MPDPVEEATKRTIEELEDRMRDALRARDVATLDALFADDLVYTHSTGLVEDKKRRLDSIKNADADFSYDSFDRSDVSVRMFGDTAVVTGHSAAKITIKGTQISANFRSLSVWVRREGRWQLAAAQTVRVKD